MTNLITFDNFDNAEIRITEDGRYSVYDVIRFCTGSKNPSQFWNGDKTDRPTRQKGIVERFPEVIRKTDNFKFPGKGQRETPVANRENILYIIGLLPGTVGRSYRESAAKVFIAFLDASPELAESIIDRATPESLKRIETRLQGKKIRVSFTAILQDRGVTEGWQFGACTNAIYRPILGGDAKQLKEERGLAKKENVRDHLSGVELAAVMLAENLALETIKNENATGFNQCHKASAKAGDRVKRVFE